MTPEVPPQQGGVWDMQSGISARGKSPGFNKRSPRVFVRASDQILDTPIGASLQLPRVLETHYRDNISTNRTEYWVKCSFGAMRLPPAPGNSSNSTNCSSGFDQ
ncbi:hypothetical protein N7519_000690 [Penicillium mononematosum]|uniref:uncharacterized protein n=1 Tax=Penicillium mononematosum TaxID=268346 RepID=UPI002547CCA4|nr:uncharacterized protein N7519_000690 [Penicillium mononematosum]KAJ6190669.1 hypothetical protein N7519_000690 [Penicillium mononematosum]